ncbi:unnamed protein product [Protopolystoma xenopodis]|uniref:Uncharacterized protein n=1 Tax=Protopolystoma xenopodis TaxID=117903 RepID=A0A448WHV4_9PLAT|nr:unnamed protein product [Protopolystoma xenopodis]
MEECGYLIYNLRIREIISELPVFSSSSASFPNPNFRAPLHPLTSQSHHIPPGPVLHHPTLVVQHGLFPLSSSFSLNETLPIFSDHLSREWTNARPSFNNISTSIGAPTSHIPWLPMHYENAPRALAHRSANIVFAFDPRFVNSRIAIVNIELIHIFNESNISSSAKSDYELAPHVHAGHGSLSLVKLPSWERLTPSSLISVPHWLLHFYFMIAIVTTLLDL